MQRLGDLWDDGGHAERAFVQKLLLHIAGKQPVTDQTWRIAEELWEKAVQDQIDLGTPFPEVKAMYFLTTLMSAGRNTTQLRDNTDLHLLRRQARVPCSFPVTQCAPTGTNHVIDGDRSTVLAQTSRLPSGRSVRTSDGNHDGNDGRHQRPDATVNSHVLPVHPA